jgi:hypothetical protein
MYPDIFRLPEPPGVDINWRQCMKVLSPFDFELGPRRPRIGWGPLSLARRCDKQSVD